MLPETPTRRKLPGGNYHDDRYAKTLTVDTSLLTGTRSYKKARKSTELQQYYDTLATDLREAKDEHLYWMMDDPLQWWLKVGRYTYPTLFKMALDFLSIPATSCECERAFSGGRRTVSIDRNSLSASTIEALQLQKNWLRRRVVRSQLSDLADHIKRQGGERNPPPPPIS